MRAVTILHTIGHGLATQDVFNLLRSELNIAPHTSTLLDWNRELKDQILAAQPELLPVKIDVAKLVAETRQNLMTNLSVVIKKTSEHLQQDKVIDAMSGRDSAVVLGISAEKLLLMAGRSPATDNLIQELTIALREIDEDIDTVLHNMLEIARKRKHDNEQIKASQAKQITDGSGSGNT